MHWLTLLALAATPAPIRVGIPPVNTLNVTKETGDFVADRFAIRLRAHGLVVMTAGETEAVLGLERQKQLLGCADGTSCAAEIAAALGVDALVRTRLAKFGTRFEITLTLIDARDARALASASESAASESALLERLDQLGDAFAARLTAPPSSPTQTVVATASSSPWPALAPGLVGLVAAGVGGGLLGASFLQVDELATAADPERLAESARLNRGLGVTLLGVGAAAMATSAVLLALRPRAVAPVVMVSEQGAAVAVVGRFP